MATYRTILFSALDPVFGPGAPLQQSNTINNNVTTSTSSTASVVLTGTSLLTLAAIPNVSTQKVLIITNLDTVAVTADVIIKTGSGAVVATLTAGGQFMISGSELANFSAWTLERSVAGTTLVRIEWGA